MEFTKSKKKKEKMEINKVKLFQSVELGGKQLTFFHLRDKDVKVAKGIGGKNVADKIYFDDDKIGVFVEVGESKVLIPMNNIQYII